MGKEIDNLSVMVDMTNIRSEATDAVDFEEHNGYVIINFLQTFPNPYTKDNVHSQNERIAKIIPRITVSREKFVHMISDMSDFALSLKDSIEYHYKQTKDILDSIKEK